MGYRGGYWMWDRYVMHSSIILKYLLSTSVLIFCSGQATTELTPFKRVIGVDPSAKMIQVARQFATANAQTTNSVDANQFEYVQSEAENLSFLEDGSVDLMVSG
jgi:SAM-dependent methyltransferase